MWRRSVCKAHVSVSRMEYLHSYHDSPKQNIMIWEPKDLLKEINRSLVRKRRRNCHRTPKQFSHNIFEGALNFPAFGLTVQSDTIKNHWIVDFHALGKSVNDRQPSVMHGLFSNKSASDAFTKMTSTSFTMRRIDGHRERICLSVQSPESASRMTDRIIEVIVVPQVKKTDDCECFRNRSDFSTDYILNQAMFGSDAISKDVTSVSY